MRRAASALGVVMGATAILYMLWIYSIATFVAVPYTEVDPGWDVPRVTYVVLGAAMLQLLAAGAAVDAPWVSVAAALLAVVGYLYPAVNGPEIFVAWQASAIVMMSCVLLSLAMQAGMFRRFPRWARSPDMVPSWELKDDPERDGAGRGGG